MRYKEVVPSLVEGKAARIKGWKNKKRIRIFYSHREHKEELYVFTLFDNAPYWREYKLTKKELESRKWEIVDYQDW